MIDRFATARSTQPGTRWRRLAAVFALSTAAALITVPADAQQFAPAPPPAAPKKQRPATTAKPAPITEATAPRTAGEPLMAIVSIKTQHVTLYDAEGWILRAPVSTGVKGRETPAGVFAVVERKEDHRSNMYDDAHMPHMQRITWNGVALHGGPLPGYAASHGCVRMPFGFAQRLFDKTRIGMRVIISPNDAAPVDIAHAVLLQPKAEAIAAAPERAQTLAREQTESAKAADAAKKAAAAAPREANAAAAALRNATSLKTRADAELAAAEKALAAATADDAKTRAEERKTKAEKAASDAKAKFDEATATAQAKKDAAASAKESIKTAEAKKAASAKAALDAKLALEPVSIYISRATQKIYVRRNTHKPAPDGGGEVFDSFEAPVTIKNAAKPIGTHVFTAVAKSDAGLRWTAVTIDDAEGGAAALDRITIPQEILDRVGPTALPRSSIVVSDEALTAETNYRTEFVAVLSNQPQGGFITREVTPREIYADAAGPRDQAFSDSFWPSFTPARGPQQFEGAPRRRGGPPVDYAPPPPRDFWRGPR
ncbi:MAG: hypothetical protein A4S14_10625 [Proteobacteria bacterium SG_bin9]|nr:MAG: hypothetical protein A4S14_10625 [Proteobacteria bacterium SG_bin9]